MVSAEASLREFNVQLPQAPTPFGGRQGFQLRRSPATCCYIGSIRYPIIAAVNVPGIGTLALAALIGPLIMLVAFLIAFLNCQKTSDTF